MALNSNANPAKAWAWAAAIVIFVVMLLGRACDLHNRQINDRWMAALLVCAVAGVGLFKVAGQFSATAAGHAAKPGTRDIGRLFLGAWLLPFELISLVLLAALFGAVFFTRAECADGHGAKHPECADGHGSKRPERAP